MISRLANVRWYLAALTGLVALVGIVLGWFYMKGSANCEAGYQEQRQKQLVAQRLEDQKIAESDVVTASREAEVRSEIIRDIAAIHRSTCLIPIECVRALNEGVRAANSGIEDGSN